MRRAPSRTPRPTERSPRHPSWPPRRRSGVRAVRPGTVRAEAETAEGGRTGAGRDRRAERAGRGEFDARRPVPARRGALLPAVALTALVTAGCAVDDGTRDDGPAPALSAPPSAMPLWPDHTAPPAETAEPTYGKAYSPLKVTLPSGGLRAMPVEDLIAKDPNVSDWMRTGLRDCPGGRCGLREPVYRDLTGDGTDELLVAMDSERLEATLIAVYRAEKRTVRPVLIAWGDAGMTGSTLGEDLIITGRYVVTGARTKNDETTRYRWDGKLMSPLGPRLGEDLSPGGDAGAQQGSTPRGAGDAPEDAVPREAGPREPGPGDDGSSQEDIVRRGPLPEPSAADEGTVRAPSPAPEPRADGAP
ncbi:hypothetical protein [Streptomyces sp. NPDC054784]